MVASGGFVVVVLEQKYSGVHNITGELILITSQEYSKDFDVTSPLSRARDV